MEVAVDLDVLGDTEPLWRAWLEDAERRYRVTLEEADEPTLDDRLGNWRVLLQRFAEDHAPVYLRPNAQANAALRRLRAQGTRIVAFTSAPEPLARIALSHLAARLVDELVAEPPAGARVVRTRDELAAAAA